MNIENKEQSPLTEDEQKRVLSFYIEKQIKFAKSIVDSPPSSLEDLRTLAGLQYNLNQETLQTIDNLLRNL